MTAEIAILNKSAVALAADSAVTISAGNRQQKTFDTADKLFELSDKNSIGVMIYNGMNFAEVPLPILISRFRSDCKPVSTVDEAAAKFLESLHEFGRTAPPAVKKANLLRIVQPLVDRVLQRGIAKFQERLFQDDFRGDPKDLLRKIMEEQIAVFERVFEDAQDAEFVGNGDFKIDDIDVDTVRELVTEKFRGDLVDLADRMLAVCKSALKKALPSPNFTGLVIAGFGSDEIFPTLVSFQLEGIVSGRLKFIRTDKVDIDRAGPKARVIPFAQKDMVERFLYGLDERIERQVTQFCGETVKSVSLKIFEHLEFDDQNMAKAVRDAASEAEKAFTDGLGSKAFAEIRSGSRAEIEDMVEFMPKPELAKMAEALVNLTSIKRRVSRGIETVGGPIDVAVISRSEGFIWVRRKHYFSGDLNPRYYERIKRQIQED